MSSGMVSPPQQDAMVPEARLRRLSESLTVLRPLPGSGDAPSSSTEALASPFSSGKAPLGS